MKKFTLSEMLVLFSLLLFTFNAKAQISVTADDFTKLMEIGTKVTTYLDTTTAQVNVGAAGENNWDLSNLVVSHEFLTESKANSGTPYSNIFTGAEYASNYSGTFAGAFSNTWVYNSVTTDFLTHGTGTVANTVAGNVKTVINYNPAWVEYKLPLKFGDNNSYTGTQTISTTMNVPVVGEITNSISQTVSVAQTVDGYGIVTMPDGKKLNALRITEVTTFTMNNNTTTSTGIRLLTKTGESVSFTPSNENEINGLINVENVSWTSGFGEGVVLETINSPSEISATVGAESIQIMWTDNSDNETGFYIERSEVGGIFEVIDSTGTGITNYTDINVVAGLDYSYRIQAYNENVLSGYSATANGTIELVIVVADPSDLSASTTSSAIEIMWADNSDNETGFYIERSEAGGIFEVIDSTGTGITNYTDINVVAGVDYSYRIQAYNENVLSGYSATANGTIELVIVVADPSDLSASTTSSAIEIMWADNSDNETGFYIERSEAGGDFLVIDSVGANVESYSDTSINTNVEYSYRIKAFSGEVLSDYSNTVSETVTTTSVDVYGNEANAYQLKQNYPNPVNSVTSISFAIPKTEIVNLSVFDTNGKLVEKLIEARLEKGEHSVIWKAGELKGGTYFYQLKTAGFLETKRMVLVK